MKPSPIKSIFVIVLLFVGRQQGQVPKEHFKISI